MLLLGPDILHCEACVACPNRNRGRVISSYRSLDSMMRIHVHLE